jgi:hypothetical protein
MESAEEYLTIEQLAQRLGWSEKTVRNKMTGRSAVFVRGIHFDSPPGLPPLFRWSAVLALYRFDGERPAPRVAAAGARLPGEKRHSENSA